MQLNEAQELRQRWGDKPCDHPNFDREYVMGSSTGDYVCTQCGQSFTREERDEIERGRAGS